MEYNHSLPRLKELRETDRRTLVCAGFQKNDGLRYAADTLSLFFWILLILGVCLLIGGLASENPFLKPYLIGVSIAILVVSPALLFWKLSLNRKADLLDYQLMIAFPDWTELIEKTDKEDQEGGEN